MSPEKTIPKLGMENEAFVSSDVVPIKEEDALEKVICGVNISSEDLYTPMAAGLVLNAEKSAPSAEKAPPMEENRAVPLFIRKEYLSASVSV